MAVSNWMPALPSRTQTTRPVTGWLVFSSTVTRWPGIERRIDMGHHAAGRDVADQAELAAAVDHQGPDAQDLEVALAAAPLGRRRHRRSKRRSPSPRPGPQIHRPSLRELELFRLMPFCLKRDLRSAYLHPRFIRIEANRDLHGCAYHRVGDGAPNASGRVRGSRARSSGRKAGGCTAAPRARSPYAYRLRLSRRSP